jgi:hypothetical protein
MKMYYSELWLTAGVLALFWLWTFRQVKLACLKGCHALLVHGFNVFFQCRRRIMMTLCLCGIGILKFIILSEEKFYDWRQCLCEAFAVWVSNCAVAHVKIKSGCRIAVNWVKQATGSGLRYLHTSEPIYPMGQIELQNHGGPLWFKNIYIREIPRQ